MNLVNAESINKKEELATEPLTKKTSAKKGFNNPKGSTAPSKELSKHPSEVILADIEEKWADFKEESQLLNKEINALSITTKNELIEYKRNLDNRLNNYGRTIEDLKKRVSQQEQEKGSWLNILRSYWSREVSIYQLAQLILDGVSPSEREEAINKILLANNENGKIEKIYRAKEVKPVKKNSSGFSYWKIAGIVIVLAVIAGGGYWIYNQNKGG